MIGFDRSAFAASPDLSGFGNQNVNRVNVRLITKDFRSIPSKTRNRQMCHSPVVLVTRTNLIKRFFGGASRGLLFQEFSIGPAVSYFRLSLLNLCGVCVLTVGFSRLGFNPETPRTGLLRSVNRTKALPAPNFLDRASEIQQYYRYRFVLFRKDGASECPKLGGVASLRSTFVGFRSDQRPFASFKIGFRIGQGETTSQTEQGDEP